MKTEYVTVNVLQILFKWKLLIFLMSPSSPMRHGSISRVMLTHKTHDCAHQRTLLCMKHPCMTRTLECGLQYPDGTLLALYSLKKQWTVNVTVQCSTISSTYLRKTKSPTPTFNKMALLRTQLTALWYFWMNLWRTYHLYKLIAPSLTGSYSTRLLPVGSSKICSYHHRPRMLNVLKAAVTAYIRNISLADLQKVLANKIKRVQACKKCCGHHFQHLL
jgi:hypothetical protein